MISPDNRGPSTKNHPPANPGKKLLITGGTGFIGGFLVPELIALGWDITVYSRRPSAAISRILPHPVYTIAHFDHWPFDQGPTACINLAGEGIMDRRWNPARKQALRDSRIGLTYQLGDWLKRYDFQLDVLLSGSAVGYYGPHEPKQRLDESGLAGRDFAAQLCADWEAAALAVPAKRTCLLRTGIVLDANHGALARLLPPFKLGLGGPVGHGRQIMPWIHIHDLVSAVVHLLSHNTASGPFNLVAPGAVSNRQFGQTLGRALDRPAVITMPALVMKLLFGEGASLLLEGQHPIPKALNKSGFSFRFPDLASALEDLL